MKLKPQRPRSCLGWFAWVFAILLVFLLLSNVYAQVRLAIARTQAEALARELGYTPDDLLLYRKGFHSADIVSGSSACDAQIFFVTPLGIDEFEAKLMLARPGTRRMNTTAGGSHAIYRDLPLDTYEANGNKLKDRDSLSPVLVMTWFLSKDWLLPTTGMAQLYQTEQIPMTLKYGERQIVNNIAVIRWPAGRYPIWVRCNPW